MDAEAAIEISGLTKIFGPMPERHIDSARRGMLKAEMMERHGHLLALNNVGLSIPAGSVTVIMGLSGSGKSTLLRAINRLVEPSAGAVLVGTANVTAMNRHELRSFRRRMTAMVFQSFALLPHRTVARNVAFGLEIQGVPRAAREDAARRWIGRVGLDGYEDRYPSELSGGMRQRVGLARALATGAPILLMDEPFSALDPLIRTDMQALLADLQADMKRTIVFVTHDLDEALRLGDRIAILREGEIVQMASGEEIVLEPADGHVAAFVRGVNRGRVLKARTIMRRLRSRAQAEGPAIAWDATLEDAARIMAAADAPVAHVVNQKGNPAGAVTLARIAGAMVAPARADSPDRPTA